MTEGEKIDSNARLVAFLVMILGGILMKNTDGWFFFGGCILFFVALYVLISIM
ncbi:MAG: hypothetical protein ACKVOM_02540 [Ferruginibacter sp.]